MSLRFSVNTHASKLLLRYDGHNRHAGVNTADKATRWRRIRRRFARWMRETAEVIDA